MFDPTYLDCYCDIDALYQRLDTRVKLVVMLSFVVIMAISVGDRPHRVIPFFLFVTVLAVISRLSPLILLRRVLPALPFFLFASIVLAFAKGGEAGIAAFLKAFLSVLSVVLLVSTTRFSELLRALEKLKAPLLLVSMISFVYRYFFIISDEYGHIKIARESRNFGGSRLWQWKNIGHSIGTLFLHSYERGDRVYSAMVARGYDGTVRTLGMQKIGREDIIFVMVSMGYLLIFGFL